MDTDLPTIAKQLRTLDKREIADWLKRGELLTEARRLVGNDAGFGSFCKEQGIKSRTAQKAMAAFRHFGDAPRSAAFSKEAMAILGQSPEARAEAIELAAREKITARIAKSLVAKFIPPALSTDTTPPAAGGTRRVIQIEGGGVVIIKSPHQATNSDLLGMIMAASRQLREPAVTDYVTPKRVA